jgi:hypothetical protein
VTFLKSALAKGALAAVVASSALATTASADIVCNRWGDCWRTHDLFDYPPGLGVVVHPDRWDGYRYHHYYHWRGDRDERGYYRSGLWITF